MVIFGQATFPATVHAEYDCVSGYFSQFDGFYSTSSGPGVTYEGASATLINNPASICQTGSTDPTANFDYEWAMVAENSNAPVATGNHPGLAQMGFFQGYGACAYFASEWHRDGYELNDYRHVHTEYGCLTANTANHYWVQYVGSDNGGNGDLRMNVDLTVMDYTPWNPYAYWLPASYGPFSTQFAAETKYLGTDIPTSNFSSMQVQQFDDTWTNTLPPLYDGCPWPARYINGGLSNNFFAIQTYGTSSNYNC